MVTVHTLGCHIDVLLAWYLSMFYRAVYFFFLKIPKIQRLLFQCISSRVTYILIFTHQNTHRGSALSSQICTDGQSSYYTFYHGFVIFGEEAKKHSVLTTFASLASKDPNIPHSV